MVLWYSNIWPTVFVDKWIPQCTYELTQTSPLKISPRLFHSKLKTLLFSKSYPDSSSSTYLPPVSTPNTIHHSRLTVCLTDSGSWPLPIDFVLVKHLCIGCFLLLRFCGRSRNQEFTITILRLRLFMTDLRAERGSVLRVQFLCAKGSTEICESLKIRSMPRVVLEIRILW